MTKKNIEISAGVLSAVEIFYDVSFNDRKMIADKCRGLAVLCRRHYHNP